MEIVRKDYSYALLMGEKRLIARIFCLDEG